MEIQTTNCHWCGEKNIPIEERGNARGYGYYGICPKCDKQTVVHEIDLTRDFY